MTKVKEIDKIRIGMLDEQEVLTEFEIKYPCKSFKYDKETGEINGKKGKEYFINNNIIYLKFLKKGYVPHLFYNEKREYPIDFKNKNKGIPSRALKLLWNTNMYKILFTPESDRTNKIIIIVMIASIICLSVGYYFRFG